MNLLLATPIQRSYVMMPPFGLGYLASAVKKKGHNVSILHCMLKKFDFDKFEEFIKQNDFDMVGMQMCTQDLNNVKRHLDIIKKIKPKTITIVGGAHPSGDPIGTMQYIKNADFAFQGEGEIGFPLLIDALENKFDLQQVSGLIWRNNEKINVNPPAFVDDLDTLEFPDWSLIDPRDYPESPHGAFAKNFPTAPIMITRGCPFQCTFCAGKKVTGLKVRKRSAKNAVKEIEFLMTNYGVKEIMIEDENFTLYRELVKDFCNLLIEKELGISWSLPSGVRLDTLDKELIELMEKSGCYSLAVGIEFGSQRIHDITKKQLTIEKIKEKMALFKGGKIKVTGFFMFGYYSETIDEIKATIKLAMELPLQRAQFNNFMPLPGSEIYNMLKKQNKLNLQTDHFFVHDVAFTPEGITHEQLKNLQRSAYLQFYLRPKIILGLFGEIRSPRHLVLLIKRFFDALT